MNEAFRKFKIKAWRDAIIKCALAAAATAFLAVNAVLLPCLLCGVHLLWVFYVLIALLGFCVGGGAAFLCFRLDDEKIAKRLDRELELKERVQTAYAYRDRDGELYDVQRDDARSALEGLSVKRLAFRGIAVTAALAFVLAVGVAALPVIVVYADITAGETTQPEDPPREVTDWEWQALDELIAHVQGSKKADDAVKSGMLTALNGLRNLLLAGVSQNSLSVFVQNTVTEIRNAVSAANSDSGITDEQKQNNSDEEEYVINKLYEIFGLNKGGGDGPSTPGGSEKPEPPVSPGNNTGTGELIINGVPFFDAENGYVSSGDIATREKYYSIIRQAMLEGTISRSEWEYIVATYFADLKNEENQEEV